MRTMSQLALAGAIALGGFAAGVAPAAATCTGAGGGMDCPLAPPYTLNSQPYVNQESVVPPGGDIYVQPNEERRYKRPRNRHYDAPVYGGYYGSGYRDRYYDDYYYVDRAVPTYRYVQPRYVAPKRYRAQQLSAAHVDYCYDRYRSYRASDNTYNPGKNRPRKQCVSPYL